jgi:hypothetical protein
MYPHTGCGNYVAGPAPEPTRRHNASLEGYQGALLGLSKAVQLNPERNDKFVEQAMSAQASIAGNM